MKKKLLSLLFAVFISITGVIAVEAWTAEEVFAWDDYPYANGAIDQVDRWNFYTRECTSFCAWRLNNNNGVNFHNNYWGVLWGDAKNWGYAARRVGIAVNSSPAVGAIAWTPNGSYGHVAWVSAVNGGSVTIEEYNWYPQYKYNSRTVPINSFQYIHIKDINVTPPPPPTYGTLDLNWVIDGKVVMGSQNYGTADIFINGNRVEDDCTDFYKSYITGTRYEARDIKPNPGHIYNGPEKSPWGTIGTGLSEIRLSFTKAENLGKDFYAYIVYDKTGTCLQNNRGNIELGNFKKIKKGKNDNFKQVWHFHRQENNVYVIKSMADTKCMDVSGGIFNNGINIGTWQSNGTIAQKWYIAKNYISGGYNLVSVNNNGNRAMNLDVAGGDTKPGTNVHLWEKNNSHAQVISIVKTNKPKIDYKDVKNSKIAFKSSVEYQGKYIKPKLKVKIGKKILKNKRDYYVKYRNNRNVGLAQISVYGKGKYHGQKKASFKIRPKKTKITLVKAENNSSIVLKWKKKRRQVSGYQIRYSKYSKMNKAKTLRINSPEKTKQTISNLKENSKYYFQIRTYKIVKGKFYYSKWSSKISATTKKYKWKKVGSGINYYASFPWGFNSQDSQGEGIWKKYGNKRIESYNSGSYKCVVNTVQNSWIYWHWTSNRYAVPSNNYNILIEDHYCWNNAHTVEFYNFRAFESGESYGEYDPNGNHDSTPGLCFYHWRNIVEDGSWWWYRFPTYKQVFTKYKLVKQ